MVALGDSITFGIGDRAGPGGAVGWAAHVAQGLQASFANLARTGARARHVREEQLPLAVAARPGIATLLVGGNDVLRSDFDLAEVAESVDAVVQALAASGARVVLVGLYGPWERLPLPRALQRALASRVHAVNHMLRALASQRQVLLVEPAALALPRTAGLWHVDRVHPGPSGHRLLAAATLGVLGAASATVPAPTVDSPGRVDQGWWLVRHGAPWFAMRGAELSPGLLRMMVAELAWPGGR